LGALLAKPEMHDAYAQRMQMTEGVLKLLQSAGVVRNDVDVHSFAYVAVALQFGLLNLGDTVPDEIAPSAEAALEATVEMVRLYLEPPGGGDSEAGKAVIQQMMAQMRARLDDFAGRDVL
jgi:hypothetical protein